MSLTIISKGEGEVSSTHKPTGVEKTKKVHTSEVQTDGTLIGFKIGYTKNLGNYESLRVEVSLTLPSKKDPKSIEAGYKMCKVWADEKLTEAIAEVAAEMGE